jgi:hypothetical protein
MLNVGLAMTGPFGLRINRRERRDRRDREERGGGEREETGGERKEEKKIYPQMTQMNADQEKISRDCEF